ncbi:hypothetical protein [Peptostreptococcus sp. D1]|uniref:hypothetical protein n=1 Tax=Peptostreptococcus sp. D1 TaxID=72304 RepID=UPI0008F2BC4B|nr:hypothetical protein [Peptostreptococcus sp. D1]SFE39045.1 hypothetical protein SAMN02910278_00760 [Peptostreptococcus sp. D1]
MRKYVRQFPGMLTFTQAVITDESVAVNQGFLTKIITERELLIAIVNGFLNDDRVPEEVIEGIVDWADRRVMDTKEKPYCWVGL